MLGGTFPALIWHDFMLSALHIDKTRAEQAAAAAAARAAGKQPGQSTTSTPEETLAPSSGAPGGSPSGEEGAGERHASPGTGAGTGEHGAAPTPATPTPSPAPTPATPSPAESSPAPKGGSGGGGASPEATGRGRAPGPRRATLGPPAPPHDPAAQDSSAGGRGRETLALPANQKRHGSSAAFVIPTRIPTAIGSSQASVRAQILIGPVRRSLPFSLSRSDAQCLGELARSQSTGRSPCSDHCLPLGRGRGSALRARTGAVPFPAGTHLIDSRKRFERSNQHRRAALLGLAHTAFSIA